MYHVGEKAWKELLRILLNTALLYEVFLFSMSFHENEWGVWKQTFLSLNSVQNPNKAAVL